MTATGAFTTGATTGQRHGRFLRITGLFFKHGGLELIQRGFNLDRFDNLGHFSNRFDF